jgi:hypothetical protein
MHTQRSAAVGCFLAALVCAVTFGAARASAAKITQPAASPVVAPVDRSGHLTAIAVSATGFAVNTPVFVEQCDGTSPTAPQWSPTEHCDLGSSPAAANADASGAVKFDPADSSHAFYPFVGESPQSIFNCNASGGRTPNNGLPNFTNCQVRVSTNNSMVTVDQQFIGLTLPAGATNRPPASTPPSTTPRSTTTTSTTAPGSAAAAKTATTSAPGSKPGSGAVVSVHVSTAGSSSGDPGLFGLSDPGVLTGYALLALGIAIAVLSVRVARSRRTTGSLP